MSTHNPADQGDILDPLRDKPKPAPSGQTPTHVRDEVCEAAGQELWSFFSGWQARHGLSPFEYLYLLTTLQRGLLQSLCVAEREPLFDAKPEKSA